MILIGQYDSPFVRRIGVALKLYGLFFEHWPLSVFADAERIRPYNPLLRVPVMVLENGDVLIESHSILDYIDRLVSPGVALFPVDEPARHQALKVASLATGIADKAVSLFYERRLHEKVSDVWTNRCQAQILAALLMLERLCIQQARPWFGQRLGHADIAVATALRFLTEAHPCLVDMKAFPALGSFCARLEALPVFMEISQVFKPPA
jgi:glutathione S-transferase